MATTDTRWGVYRWNERGVYREFPPFLWSTESGAREQADRLNAGDNVPAGGWVVRRRDYGGRQ